MAVWPVTLPQIVSWEGYTQEIQDTGIRTPMDAGPPKVRSKYTAAIINHNLPVQFFTKAQWGLLLDFYFTTLQMGTQPFEWTDPIAGNTVNFRFRKPPQFVKMQGSQYLDVTLPVEVLP